MNLRIVGWGLAALLIACSGPTEGPGLRRVEPGEVSPVGIEPSSGDFGVSGLPPEPNGSDNEAGAAVQEPSPEVRGEPRELRWQWREGDSARYDWTELQRVEMDSGMEIVSGEELTLGLELKVVGVDGTGAADLEATLENVRLTVELPKLGPVGGTVRFDSRTGEKPKDATARGWSKLVGSTFRFRMDPFGNVSEVRGTAAMLTTFLDALGIGAMFQEAEYQARLGPDGWAQGLSRAFGGLPQSSVAAGQSWPLQTRRDVRLVGTLEARGETRFAGEDGGRAVLSESAKLEVVAGPKVGGNSNAGTSLPAGSKVLRQDAAGSVEFDLTSGRILRRVSELHLDTTSVGKTRDGSPGPKMSRKVVATTQLEIVR